MNMSFRKLNPFTWCFKSKPEADINSHNDFLDYIIQRMGTCFATPEEKIIDTGEKSGGIFYISTGDCTVNVFDYHRGNENVAIRLLVEGQFFGEIAFIY